MKIIGKTEDGFILEASADDISAIEGFYTRYEKRFKLGDVIDISGLHKKYCIIDKALQQMEQTKMRAEELIAAIEWIKDFRK